MLLSLSYSLFWIKCKNTRNCGIIWYKVRKPHNPGGLGVPDNNSLSFSI